VSEIRGTLKGICFFVITALCVMMSPLRAAAGLPAPSDKPDGVPYTVPRPNDVTYQIPRKGCSLYIDLDNCNMIVFMDGKPLKAYPVSGGTNENPSPVGTWRVAEISNWGEGFGGSWIGLDVPWGKYGIHGTVAPWFVGEYNVSHGCIRMRDKDVAEVKTLIARGTVVHIKQDTAPFREMSHGMTGSDVMKTQKLLKKLGYYSGTADGVFGDATELAVRKFQWRAKLREDGIVGHRTYDKLHAQSEAK
jgi:hypothetical protein